MTRRFHLLTQYVWPDDAPTGIYAEQVADALTEAGVPVQLVAGRGEYRPGSRPRPSTPIERVSHRLGRRGALLSTAFEYASVNRAFARYLARSVFPGDMVMVTSAPPTSVFLHRQVRRRGARGVYWLQDYYPQLIRGVWDAPRAAIGQLDRLWKRALASWDAVVKSAANLAYSGDNAAVFRNWNTLDPGEPQAMKPGTALYSGNLGYGHDIDAFVRLCSALRADGFEVTVRGDGPGMKRLPDWICTERPVLSSTDLVRSYWQAEVHLVAADPRLTGAIFPSKIWNSIATGRTIRSSGFEGPMKEELDISLRSDLGAHLRSLVDYLHGFWRAGGGLS